MDVDADDAGSGSASTVNEDETLTFQGQGHAAISSNEENGNGGPSSRTPTSRPTTFVAKEEDSIPSPSKVIYKPVWAATGILRSCLDPRTKKIKDEDADLEFVCEDQIRVKGHRVVFALFSRFFASIFEDQAGSSLTTVILDKIQAKHMRTIRQLAYGQPREIMLGEKDLKEVCHLLHQFGLDPKSFGLTLNNGMENIETFWVKTEDQDEGLATPRDTVPQSKPTPLPPWVTMADDDDTEEETLSKPNRLNSPIRQGTPKIRTSSGQRRGRHTGCDSESEDQPLAKRLRSSSVLGARSLRGSQSKAQSQPPPTKLENVWGYICKICKFHSTSETGAIEHGAKCCTENNSPIPHKSSFDRQAFEFYGNVQCPVEGCGKRFMQLLGIVVHTRKMHPNFKELFAYKGKIGKLICNNCGQEFNTPVEFYEHLDSTHQKCPETRSLNSLSLDETPFRPVTRSSIKPTNLNTSLPFLKSRTGTDSRTASTLSMSLRSSTRGLNPFLETPAAAPTLQNIPANVTTTETDPTPTFRIPRQSTRQTNIFLAGASQLNSATTSVNVTTASTLQESSTTTPVPSALTAPASRSRVKNVMAVTPINGSRAILNIGNQPVPRITLPSLVNRIPLQLTQTPTSIFPFLPPISNSPSGSASRSRPTSRVIPVPTTSSETTSRDPPVPTTSSRTTSGVLQVPTTSSRTSSGVLQVPTTSSRMTSGVLHVPTTSSRTTSSNVNPTQSSRPGGMSAATATPNAVRAGSVNNNQLVRFPGEPALGRSRVNVMDFAEHLTDSELLIREFKCRHCNDRKQHYRDSAACLKKHGFFRCNLCFNTYRTKELLDEHIREVHTRSETGELICPVCSQACKSPGGMASHIYSHWVPILRRALPESEWTDSMRRGSSGSGSNRGRGGGSGRR